MDKLLEDGKQQNITIEPRMKDVYETYCLWKSLPAMFKFPPKDKQGYQPSSKDFCEVMGIDDEDILDLVTIKTQMQFAERFEVDRLTLTRWNKTLGVRQSLQDIRAWARYLSKNVITALYNKAIRKGDAFEAKLWFQLVEGWEEKGRIEHEHGDIKFNIILKKPTNGDQLGTIGETNGSVGDIARQDN